MGPIEGFSAKIKNRIKGTLPLRARMGPFKHETDWPGLMQQPEEHADLSRKIDDQCRNDWQHRRESKQADLGRTTIQAHARLRVADYKWWQQ